MNGSNGFCFTAPVSLLSRLSAPIDALVQSAVEGAHTCVNLEVSDKDTFYRFFQFVYMGNYDEFTSPENAHLADNTKNGLPVLAKTSAERSDVVETRPVLFGASSTSDVPGTSAQSPFGGNPSGGALFGGSTQSVPSGGASFGFGSSTRPVFGGGSLFGRPAQTVPTGGGLFGRPAAVHAREAGDGWIRGVHRGQSSPPWRWTPHPKRHQGWLRKHLSFAIQSFAE
jgi:hypothetical protein